MNENKYKCNIKYNGRILNLSENIKMNGLTNLIELDLSYYENISGITALSSLINLEKLNLYMTNIDSIEPLKELIKLKELDLSYSKVSDFSPLSSLVNLEILELENV